MSTSQPTCPSRSLVDLVQRDWPAALAAQFTSGAWPRPLWESAQLRLQDVQAEANRRQEWFQARSLAGAMVLELGTDPTPAASNNTLPIIRPRDPAPNAPAAPTPEPGDALPPTPVILPRLPTNSEPSSAPPVPFPAITTATNRIQPVIVRATVPPPHPTSTVNPGRFGFGPEPTRRPLIPNSILLYLFSDSSAILLYPSNPNLPDGLAEKLAKCSPVGSDAPSSDYSTRLQRRSALALGCIRQSSSPNPESCFVAADLRSLACGASGTSCRGSPVFLDTAASEASAANQPPKWIVASIIGGALVFIVSILLIGWFIARTRRLASPRLSDPELAGMYGESSLSQTQLPPRRASLLAPTAYTTESHDPYGPTEGRRNSTSSVPLLQDHRLDTSDQPISRQYRRASDSFVVDARFGDQSPILQQVQEQILREQVQQAQSEEDVRNQSEQPQASDSPAGAFSRLRQLLFAPSTTPRPQSLPPPESPPTVERTLRRANRSLRGVIPPTPSGGGMQSVYLFPLTFGHQPSPQFTLLPALPNLTSSAMQDILNGWTRVRFLAQAAVHHLPPESRPVAMSAVGAALVDALRFTDHLRLTFPSTPTISELRDSSTTMQGMLQWFNAAEQAVRDVDPAHVPPSHPLYAATVGIVTQAQQAANQVWIPQDKSQVVDSGRVVRAALIALVQIKCVVPFVAGIMGIPGRPMDARVMTADSSAGPPYAAASGEGSMSVGTRAAGGADLRVVERAVFPGLMDMATGRVLCPCLCTIASSSR